MMAIAELPSATITPRSSANDRPWRVCHVSLTLKTGGLERILADLARHHHPDAVTPSFVALREVGRFADEIRRTGCVVHRIQATRRWGQVCELATWLRRERIDVVHTHNTYPHLYATLAARWAGVPVVVQTRHGQRAGHGWKSSFLYRQATRLADRVVAVSDDAARLCLTVDHLPPRKVARIWNGIDLSTFAYHGPVAAPIAISVARLSPEKDFPTLLRAMAGAIQIVPELRLKLVGDGP
jgi:glycosyltransferase involved in cell wall biosynthesis